MPIDPAQAAWDSHIRGLIGFAEDYARNSLQRETTQARTSKLIRKLELVADSQIGRMQAQIASMEPGERAKWTPDCKEGCSHCCYQVVGVTVPEVLAFADYIRENCTESEIERFKEGARNYRKSFESAPKGHHPMFACPVLHDDRCAAYGGRCLICRGYNSLDVNRCIERREHPERHVEVKGITQMLQVSLNLRSGLRNAFRARGLDSGLVVLGLALGTALEDPSSGEKYLAGEDVFGWAALPPEIAAETPPL